MRYDLTDFEWSVIEPLLPKDRRGPKPKNNRQIISVRREKILPRQPARRHQSAHAGCHHQGAMGVRAGPSADERRTRPRSLRRPILARPAPACAHDDDRLRLPPASPPRKQGGKKNNLRATTSAQLACRAKCHRQPNHPTAAAMPALPEIASAVRDLKQICQSSASPPSAAASRRVRPHLVRGPITFCFSSLPVYEIGPAVEAWSTWPRRSASGRAGAQQIGTPLIHGVLASAVLFTDALHLTRRDSANKGWRRCGAVGDCVETGCGHNGNKKAGALASGLRSQGLGPRQASGEALRAALPAFIACAGHDVADSPDNRVEGLWWRLKRRWHGHSAGWRLPLFDI